MISASVPALTPEMACGFTFDIRTAVTAKDSDSGSKQGWQPQAQQIGLATAGSKEGPGNARIRGKSKLGNVANARAVFQDARLARKVAQPAISRKGRVIDPSAVPSAVEIRWRNRVNPPH